MNLKLYLTMRIALLAFLCLFLASGYVLWEAEREQQRHVSATLEMIAKRLQIRLTSIDTGFDRQGRLLYWDPLAESEISAGFCVRYVDAAGRTGASSCRGSDLGDRKVPAWFAAFYRVAFSPGKETVRELSWRRRDYGRVVGLPDADNQIAQAWNDVGALMGLTAVTVFALCILVYFSIGRALRPTREVLLGLERLERGDLSSRLPQFELIELQKMSKGFNRLATSLEHSIAERAELTRKLINVQEEERRHLARELHDEFGQCLAAINAIAASVNQTAEQECPVLLSDGEKLTRIATQMMQTLRSMLLRLRPPGIDELGLVGSLKSLVAQWNSSATRVELETNGDLAHLPEAVTVNVFRIVQECLTNVSKHAGATRVKVRIERQEPLSGHAGSSINLTVEDDGKMDSLAFTCNPGLGLLGMRERVAALGGQLRLKARQSSGLAVHARIPLVSAS